MAVDFIATLTTLAVLTAATAPTAQARVFGIDLGTVQTCASVYNGEAVEIIPNSKGNSHTPAVISFGNARFIGEDAVTRGAKSPVDTVHNFKGILGKSSTERSVQHDQAALPYTFVEDGGDRPKVTVTHRNKSKEFLLEELAMMILRDTASYAKDYTGEEVKDVAITVPSSYNDAQRRATLTAAQVAGLNVVRLVNEPTAVAFAYRQALEEPLQPGESHDIVALSLGAGATSVSVVRVWADDIQVLTTAGDSNLGGNTLDRKVLDAVRENLFKRTHVDIFSDPHVLQAFRDEVNRARVSLSDLDNPDTPVEIKHGELAVTLTQRNFDAIVKTELEDIMNVVHQAVSDANITRSNQIHNVVASGGLAKMPGVVDMLARYFGKAPVNVGDPEDTACLGVGLVAQELEKAQRA